MANRPKKRTECIKLYNAAEDVIAAKYTRNIRVATLCFVSFPNVVNIASFLLLF